MTELTVHAILCDAEPMVQADKLRADFVKRLKKALSHSGIAEWGAGVRLAEIAGTTPKAVSKWLNMESMPGRKNMLAIADALGVRVEWLQYGEGSMLATDKNKESNVVSADFSSKKIKPDEVEIPQYDVRAAMGHGQQLPSDYVETVRHITVGLDFFRQQGCSYSSAKNLAVITGFGESMNKTFASGDPLIIDKGVTTVVTDGVYLFTLSGALLVKRLQVLPNGIRVLSDSDAYPPYDIVGSDLDGLIIHARVLLAWRSQKL